MSCGKCGRYGKLCPFTFGLALGLTCAIGVLIWAAWMMFGLPVLTVGHMMAPASWMGAWVMAGWCLLKGFIAGFIFALIYDIIMCCCKGRCKCCNTTNGACGCGSASCSCGTKPPVA